MLRVVLFRCDELRMQHIFSSVNIHKILVFMCICVFLLLTWTFTWIQTSSSSLFRKWYAKYMEFLGIYLYIYVWIEVWGKTITKTVSMLKCICVPKYASVGFVIWALLLPFSSDLHRSHSRVAIVLCLRCESIYAMEKIKQMQKPNENLCKKKKNKPSTTHPYY